MKPKVLSRCKWAVLLLAALTSSGAHATWSIVMVDSATKEVAVGTVTCLDNFDLLALVPVVVVGKGGAAVQAAGDFPGTRRPIIFDHLMAGTSPQEILNILAGIGGHSSRQYGIVDHRGRKITFTGISTFQWAGGVVGSQGTMHYAIQGNILAGPCVVPAIEQAILNTAGDIPAKLMAGMEAAREAGGDGRCSCSGSPTSCGCPPPNFTKSGHIGCMVVARVGDSDDPACNRLGCADGDYLLRINVAFQPIGAPDPVFQLRDLFDAWRAGLMGRPDAIQSTVQLDPRLIPPDGTTTSSMRITLNDFSGQRITAPILSLTVQHAPDSAGLSSIGPVTDHGDGTFSLTLTAGNAAGTDRFVVTADDGMRPVVLAPPPTLRYFPFGDMNCDGALNGADIDPFFLALGDPTRYGKSFPGCLIGLADMNRDGSVNGGDIDAFFTCLGGLSCP